MTDTTNLSRLIDATIEGAEADELPAILGVLRAAEARAMLKIVRPPKQAPDARGELLTAQEMGVRYSVPASFFYELARQGRLPVVKLGRYRRFRPSDVARVLGDPGAADD